MFQTTAVTTPLNDAGDAFKTALANTVAFLPKLLAFILILVIGWFLASLIAKAISSLLKAIKFNDLAQRAGLTDFVRNMGLRATSADVIGAVAKWFVRLIALVVAFDALGLPAVSDVLRQLLLWLPNLVVALVILVVGGLAAGALSRVVRGATAEAGFRNPDTLAMVAKVAVWGFALVVAVNQLGIATVLINTLLFGVVGALAIASGLAFGLGGRDKAARVLDRWGGELQEAGPRLQAAGRYAREEITGEGNRPWVERTPGDRRRRG